MPNLNYDPKNPRDALGRDIAIGDVVAWGTNVRHSAAIAVCVIERIRFTYVPQGKYKNVECRQDVAEAYTLYLRKIGGTSVDASWRNKLTGRIEWRIPPGEDPYDWEQNPVRVQLVKNVVRLDMTEQEVLAYVHANPDTN